MATYVVWEASLGTEGNSVGVGSRVPGRQLGTQLRCLEPLSDTGAVSGWLTGPTGLSPPSWGPHSCWWAAYHLVGLWLCWLGQLKVQDDSCTNIQAG